MNKDQKTSPPRKVDIEKNKKMVQQGYNGYMSQCPGSIDYGHIVQQTIQRQQ